MIRFPGGRVSDRWEFLHHERSFINTEGTPSLTLAVGNVAPHAVRTITDHLIAAQYRLKPVIAFVNHSTRVRLIFPNGDIVQGHEPVLDQHGIRASYARWHVIDN